MPCCPFFTQVCIVDAAQASRDFVRARSIAPWDAAGWMHFLHATSADEAAVRAATAALTGDMVAWVRQRVMQLLQGAWA